MSYQLNDEVIEEYRSIYRKVYGREITLEEAREQGSRLVNFFEIITSPDNTQLAPITSFQNTYESTKTNPVSAGTPSGSVTNISQETGNTKS